MNELPTLEEIMKLQVIDVPAVQQEIYIPLSAKVGVVVDTCPTPSENLKLFELLRYVAYHTYRIARNAGSVQEAKEYILGYWKNRFPGVSELFGLKETAEQFPEYTVSEKIIANSLELIFNIEEYGEIVGYRLYPLD